MDTRLRSLRPLCCELFCVWVTDHRRSRLHFSINGQDLFSAQQYDSLPPTHSNYLFEFSYLISQVIRQPLIRNIPTSCPITGKFLSIIRNNHFSHWGSNLLPSYVKASMLIIIPLHPHIWQRIFACVIKV